jgi:hypothetical protein
MIYGKILNAMMIVYIFKGTSEPDILFRLCIFYGSASRNILLDCSQIIMSLFHHRCLAILLKIVCIEEA